MRTPRTASPRVVALRLALGLALFAAGGCGTGDEVVTTRFSPDVIAVTAPDSVPAGQAVDVAVHWISFSSCQSIDELTVHAVDETTFQVLVVARETSDPRRPCSPIDTLVESGFRIPAAPARRFEVQVFGAHQRFEMEVHGGTQPAAVSRHHVFVKNQTTSAPAPGAVAKVIDLATRDTLAVLVTGDDGEADSVVACGGAPRAYRLWVTGVSGRAANLYFRQKPARCGVPERTKIRL